jgi:hypothetical protein
VLRVLAAVVPLLGARAAPPDRPEKSTGSRIRASDGIERLLPLKEYQIRQSAGG